MKHIRNFSIIAHIDHGKSTLADRLIQATNIVSNRNFKNQILDNMEIERERGITIKSQTICLPYKSKNGKLYNLNLIDTPGHVDFSYEVSRALASCEGALLLIDASQGVEAQTLANLYLAMEHDLKIIPVINKIDLPSAKIDIVKEQIKNDLGLNPNNTILTSAKKGTGITKVLESIISYFPSPSGNIKKPFKAIIFDSHYDQFKGVIINFRIIDGSIKSGDTVLFIASNATHKVEEVGLFQIVKKPQPFLSAGQVGYMTANIKTIDDIHCGDTITLKENSNITPMPGFKTIKPVVFASIYPINSDSYQYLELALKKLKLNDASLIYEKDVSTALGFGFRCGFLGLLHLEVVQERLKREYNIPLILTAPTVMYKIILKNGKKISIDNPSLYPDATFIEYITEPFTKITIIIPDQYIGATMQLCIKKRGFNKNYQYLTNNRIEMTFEMPLSEIIYDFYDNLKSTTQGYGSLDYELTDHRKTDLVKIDFLINGEKIDALSQLIYRDKAILSAKKICKKLEKTIPRQMYKIAIQGAIGSKIISRSTIPAYRKDVTAKCYGGDISRKRKLLEKQKKGKSRMKMVGKIMLPPSVFLSAIKKD